ncbi:hypothetical protein QOT17_000950 [Balamuthia mandrillaris]
MALTKETLRNMLLRMEYRQPKEPDYGDLEEVMAQEELAAIERDVEEVKKQLGLDEEEGALKDGETLRKNAGEALRDPQTQGEYEITAVDHANQHLLSNFRNMLLQDQHKDKEKEKEEEENEEDEWKDEDDGQEWDD